MSYKKQNDKSIELTITRSYKERILEYYIINTISPLSREPIETHVLAVKFFNDKFKDTEFYKCKLIKYYYITYNKDKIEISRNLAKTYEKAFEKMKIMYNKKYN